VIMVCDPEPCPHSAGKNAGTGGCGGAGGLGGLPGSNAGSSIGLYVTKQSTVRVINGEIAAGDGGEAGKGSAGSLGAAGTNGAVGAETEDPDCFESVFDCRQASPNVNNCHPEPGNYTPWYAPGGIPGGSGGTGGPGGAGGSGVGGFSYATAHDQTSTVELAPKPDLPLLKWGNAGQGVPTVQSPAGETLLFKSE
jgi:hypothetical protein